MHYVTHGVTPGAQGHGEPDGLPCTAPHHDVVAIQLASHKDRTPGCLLGGVRAKSDGALGHAKPC